MSAVFNGHDPEQADRVAMYALSALPAGEAFAIEAHLRDCEECREQLQKLRPVVDSFVAWPRALLRPTTPLWGRLESMLDDEPANAELTAVKDDWQEPDWEQAAPGLWYQLLSKDDDTHRVTMLVRLEPGVEYPPHAHAGTEELHLLDGELWIDDRKLYPGDYNRAEAGTADRRVWSETGCACVLITSHRDLLK
ncbi:MAG TPA: cupin domain-containing protein [Polyangiaceae bacterium]